MGTWQNNDSTSFKNCYVPLRHLIEDHTWKDLKPLRLDCLLLCQNDLAAFLIRHSSTLKDIQIYTLGLWQGTIKGLLYTLRDYLQIDRFHIRGLLMGFRTNGESWRLFHQETTLEIRIVE